MTPLGAGYHIIQSKIAIGSGGLHGKGWLQGTQSPTLNFYQSAIPTFIFAVLAEELGTDWCFNPTNALYILLIARGLYLATKSTKYIWQSHDWWINADLCLCFRQYWYGEGSSQ